MPYITSPYAPKTRRLAVQDVRKKRLNITQATNKYGVHRTTMYRWIKKASYDHREFIETKKSTTKTPDPLTNFVLT